MLRVVVLLLVVLLSTFEVKAATQYPVTVGGVPVFARSQGCWGAAEGYALAKSSESNPGLVYTTAWSLRSCTFDATTGIASNVSVFVMGSNYPNLAVTWGTPATAEAASAAGAWAIAQAPSSGGSSATVFDPPTDDAMVLAFITGFSLPMIIGIWAWALGAIANAVGSRKA